MRLLLLGGTDFVGHAVAAEALRRGAEVTVFHRGRHAAPAGVRVLHGDRTRDGGLAALADDPGEWDTVVDTWADAPSAVRDSARLLARRTDRYVYVSSRSVYDEPAAGADEGTPLVDASPDDGEVPYPRAKRGGELAALDVFGDRALLLRAGLILGPRENIGRLPWWLRRIARGGPVPAPGPHGLPIQHVDARDLAAFALDAADRGLGGPYDVVSAPGHATMGELLDACVAATGSGAQLRWLTPERVARVGALPWTELPVWIPPGDLHAVMHGSDVTKALAAGLRCRPVAETVADTWEWLRALPAPPEPYQGRTVGLPPDKDAALLSRQEAPAEAG